MGKIRIIGGGLAGSECALTLARLGHLVELVEMRPVRSTEAHQSDRLAELVCSNSFRSNSPTNAVGLLKREMEILGSHVMRTAEIARVPAGDALAVDRERFAAEMTRLVESEANITLQRREVTSLERDGVDALVVATGPLTSGALYEAIGAELGTDDLYFYDSIAPIVAADSLDMSKLYWKSRYDKGGARDYLNAAFTREEYERFVEALLSAELYPLHDFEKSVHFEGCLPIEEIAGRGIDTLRFGPMKPVGLEHPETGEMPWAVVQLRREDLSDEFFNLVGFQTKMKIGEQKRVFSMIPGLESFSAARWGSMHRNTFINGPRHLTPTFALRNDPRVWFAGQITGVEGYIESAATGLSIAWHIDDALHGVSPRPFPYETAIGGLARHVAESNPDRYQPSNITWALIEDRVGRMKKDRKREKQAELALSRIESIAASRRVVVPAMEI